jgi:hypothetical protein
MNKKTMRILVEAGALKKIKIVARGSRFYVEAVAAKDTLIAETARGKIRTWATIDAAARWVRSIGVGKVLLSLDQWQPAQQEISLSDADKHKIVQEQMDV